MRKGKPQPDMKVVDAAPLPSFPETAPPTAPISLEEAQANYQKAQQELAQLQWNAASELAQKLISNMPEESPGQIALMAVGHVVGAIIHQQPMEQRQDVLKAILSSVQAYVRVADMKNVAVQP